MALVIPSGVQVYNSRIRVIAYQQQNAPQYPQFTVTLAYALDGSAYNSGQILGVYTDVANCPANNPAYIGTYVKYDPASANPDVNTPVAIITADNVNDLLGMNLETGTASESFNLVAISKFAEYSTQPIYALPCEQVNTPAAITGFKAKWDTRPSYFGVVQYNQQPSDIWFIGAKI